MKLKRVPKHFVTVTCERLCCIDNIMKTGKHVLTFYKNLYFLYFLLRAILIFYIVVELSFLIYQSKLQKNNEIA